MMATKLSLLALLLLVLIGCSNGQDSCQTSNSGTLVGFTALTPDQLKVEIRTSVQNSMTELFESLSSSITTETSDAIEDLNYTIQTGLAKIEELNTNFTESILSSIDEVVERQVKLVVSALIENITSATPQTPVTTVTTPPPPTTKATTTTSTTPQPTTQAPTLPPVGLSPLNPATSCKEIHESLPAPPSGLYWVTVTSERGQPLPDRVYCDMERVCGGARGGWMRVANINMQNPRQTCPNNFREVIRTEAPLRLCATQSTGRGCQGTFFQVNGVPYSHVCGRVIGYQDKTPNGFYSYHINPRLTTIHDPYVDGISLTHGTSREHIWTFVSALDETAGHLSACICSNRNVTTHATIPPFVGNDYFCDTASRETVEFQLYGDDPLWDGEGCGTVSSCCTFNNPPWFSKQLGSSVTDDIEFRVCRDSSTANEDIPFEIVELYVR